METYKFTRRQALQATAVVSTALLLPVDKIDANTPAQGFHAAMDVLGKKNAGMNNIRM